MFLNRLTRSRSRCIPPCCYTAYPPRDIAMQALGCIRHCTRVSVQVFMLFADAARSGGSSSPAHRDATCRVTLGNMARGGFPSSPQLSPALSSPACPGHAPRTRRQPLLTRPRTLPRARAMSPARCPLLLLPPYTRGYAWLQSAPRNRLTPPFAERTRLLFKTRLIRASFLSGHKPQCPVPAPSRPLLVLSGSTGGRCSAAPQPLC